MRKTIFKVTSDLYPQSRDRYPLMYLEHGRLEVDDSSVKWIGANLDIFAVPVAVISTLLLGPGTTVTHEAVKAITSCNTTICWVGDDSLRFYAAGICVTADTRNLIHQIDLYSDAARRVEVARKMFQKRFPDQDLEGKTLPEMMGMEGVRVRSLYKRKSEKYGVEWVRRNYIPGASEKSDFVNRSLTFTNSLLYSIITSSVISRGYDPRIGFIHSGSPLPLIYDLADLFKEELTIDLSFSLYKENLEKPLPYSVIIDRFVNRVVDTDFINRLHDAIDELFEEV